MPAGLFPWIALAVVRAVPEGRRGRVWVHMWHMRPASVLTSARPVPWAMVP
jgi:hypothetical protein